MFLCTYVFNIKYHNIIPRLHAADRVDGLQKLRVPRIRVQGNTPGNNRQQSAAVRSFLVENMAYYWSYTTPRHRRIIQTTVAMENGRVIYNLERPSSRYLGTDYP